MALIGKVVTTVQMGKVRSREGKELVQGHSGCEQQHDPGSSLQHRRELGSFTGELHTGSVAEWVSLGHPHPLKVTETGSPLSKPAPSRSLPRSDLLRGWDGEQQTCRPPWGNPHGLGF